MPLPLGDGAIMILDCLSVRPPEAQNAIFPPVHAGPLVYPTNRYHSSVSLFIRLSREISGHFQGKCMKEMAYNNPVSQLFFS